MPAPLVQPSRRTARPERVQRDAAHFGRVSVVIIARVKPPKPSAVRSAALTKGGTAFRMRSTRNGKPITPVEQTNTCSGSQPNSRATAWAVAWDAAIPSSPVAQFALREFTITARMRDADLRRWRRQRTTGAACTRFWVKTAAAATSSSAIINPKSRLGAFRKPQFVAANRNPRGRALSGAVFIRGVSVFTAALLLSNGSLPLLQASVASGQGLADAWGRRSAGNVATG